MRILVSLCLFGILTAISPAQGTINFANIGSGWSAPVFLYDGSTKVSGSGWTAELLVGSTLNRMKSVAHTGFLSGGGAGYFSGGAITVDEIVPGATAWCVVQFWATAQGSFTNAFASGTVNSCGASAPFQIVLGGGGVPPGSPAQLDRLTSVIVGGLPIYEEPKPALRLSSTGSNQVSLTWNFLPFFSWRSSLQQTHDLTKPNWTAVTNDFAVDQSLLRVTVSRSQTNTFYRLVQ